MKYAPIYIPTLNRFGHLKKCLESLMANSWASKTDVFIALDFPPSEKYKEGWLKVKEYLETGDFSGFCSFTVLERPHNYGPSRNSQATREYLIGLGYDRWIYSEDDIEFSPNFLEYMDKCLEYYYDDPDVIGVTGYSYPIEWTVSENATCFKQMFNASMWGTGFWVHKFSSVSSYLSEKGLKHSIKKVLRDKTYEDMIETAQKEYFNEAFSTINLIKINWCRRNSDIAIRAYLAVERKYFITPVVSKTRNIGFDGSGANCQNATGAERNPSLYAIDSEATYSFVPDEKCCYRENRNLMNRREHKTREEMSRTHLLVNVAERFGVTIAKLVALLFVPSDALDLIKYKLRK